MRKKKGVTLIELLVVIVASGIILSTVLASFASLIKVTQKIDTSRQLQKEINFALIRMADRMREDSINYDAYKEGACTGMDTTQNTKVCIGDYVFEKEESIVRGDETFYTLAMDGERLFSSKFNIRKVAIFDITPGNDPTQKDDDGTPYPNFQPKLTIYLDVESIQYPDINFQIQTTISSRKYQ